MSNKPTCYIIAGPNGAGKTTFALRYLPFFTNCDNFVNADMIADGISPINPEKMQITASRIFLKELVGKIESHEDFSFETTLSGRSYLKLVKGLKQKGWNIVLFYLWIPNKEFSAKRVQLRVSQGGHDIPSEAIKRRYRKSLHNLELYSKLCDMTYCYDNSGLEPELILLQDKGGKNVLIENIYANIMEIINGQ